MRYLGGKFRQGKKIAEIVARYLKPGGTYIEPFCGSLWSACAVAKVAPPNVKMILSDKNEALVVMWKALLAGWTPPTHVSEREYLALKYTQDPQDPTTAFVAFGCSMAAKWFNGYARSKTHTVNFARQAIISSMKKLATLRNAAQEAKDSCEKKIGILRGRGLSFTIDHRDYTAYGGGGEGRHLHGSAVRRAGDAERRHRAIRPRGLLGLRAAPVQEERGPGVRVRGAEGLAVRSQLGRYCRAPLRWQRFRWHSGGPLRP